MVPVHRERFASLVGCSGRTFGPLACGREVLSQRG
jgi:hypothetical protein